jgi:hypothetical protein
MAGYGCSGRRVNDIEMDAGLLRRRWHPHDLSALGPFTIKHLVVRYDDR